MTAQEAGYGKRKLKSTAALDEFARSAHVPRVKNKQHPCKREETERNCFLA